MSKIVRRQFLAFMAFIPITPLISRPKSDEPKGNEESLIIHNGWILKRSDLKA